VSAQDVAITNVRIVVGTGSVITMWLDATACARRKWSGGRLLTGGPWPAGHQRPGMTAAEYRRPCT
jgi:hypothetical protein